MKKLKILVILPLILFSFGKLDAQVTIGSDVAPNSFSVLELISRHQAGSYGGLRLPQLTIEQRNSIADLDSPEARGLMIYNKDIGCLEFWNGREWISLCSDIVRPPTLSGQIYH